MRLASVGIPYTHETQAVSAPPPTRDPVAVPWQVEREHLAALLRAEDEVEGELGLARLRVQLRRERPVAGGRDLHVQVGRAPGIDPGEIGLEAVLSLAVGGLGRPMRVIVLPLGIGLTPLDPRLRDRRAAPGRADDACHHQAAAEARPLGGTARVERTLRSEEHTSELQSPTNLVCRLLLEKK